MQHISWPPWVLTCVLCWWAILCKEVLSALSHVIVQRQCEVSKSHATATPLQEEARRTAALLWAVR